MINFLLVKDKEIPVYLKYWYYKTKIEGLVFNKIYEATKVGTSLVLDNTIEHTMKINLLASDTTQNTTTGKNLFKASSSNYKQGLTIKFNETTGAISFNGTTTGGYPTLSNFTNTNIPSGIYTFSIDKTLPYGLTMRCYNEQGEHPYNISIQAGNKSNTATIDYTIKRLEIVYSITTSQVTVPVTTIYPQFENGSTATPFEPYTGGRPSPNPDYPQEIHVVKSDNQIVVSNKNIYNGLYEVGGYDVSTGEKTTNLYQYRNVDFIPVKPNTSYTFSLDSIKISEEPRYFFYDISKNKISTTVTNGTFTTPNNCYYINWHSSGLKSDYPNGLIKPMIEEGTTATSYVEHKEQNYSINLGVINLFDKDNANIINAYLGNGKIVSSNSARCIYIPCKPNTTYTVSKLKGNRFAVAYCETEPQINADVSIIQDNNATHITITTNDTGNYLVVWFYSGTYDTTISEQEMMSSVQIEEGSIAHSYSPYGQEPVELCKIVGYQDLIFKNSRESEYYDSSLENGKWYKLSKIGKIIFDGSENWETPTTNGYSFPKNQIINANLPTNTITNYIVNNFTKVEYPDTFVIGTCRVGGSYLNFNFDNSNSNLNDFKSWLSTHNTIVYYVLATPTKTLLPNTLQEELEELENATSYNEQTNITQVNDDRPFILDVSYFRKVKYNE